jgi:hypothetical protein
VERRFVPVRVTRRSPILSWNDYNRHHSAVVLGPDAILDAPGLGVQTARLSGLLQPLSDAFSTCRMYAAGDIQPKGPRVSASTDGVDIAEVYIKRSWSPDARSSDFENSGELRMNAKIAWSWAVTAVQPRIRLTRSFDERSHTIWVTCCVSREQSAESLLNFEWALGSGTHAKHQLRIGDHIEGSISNSPASGSPGARLLRDAPSSRRNRVHDRGGLRDSNNSP